MPAKTVALSVRVSSDDAEFLARLPIEGANTPSEKLRAVLREERRRREGFREYKNALSLTREMLAPTVERTQEAENEIGLRSDLIHMGVGWLPDVFATALTGLPPEGSRDDDADLAAFESRLADRIFGLIESTLRLGVTKQVRGCDPDIVASRMPPLLELVDVVRATHARESEG